MDLSIIIISYNTKDLLVECLQSIFKQADDLKKEVIVVDNNSSDGTQEIIASHFPQVKLIQNQKNYGFAKANNQVIGTALGEYFLFLNSDTIIRNQAISTLIQSARDHNSEIASCQLQNHNLSIQPQGGSLPDLFNIFTWMTFIDDLPILKQILPRYQQSNSSYFTKDQEPGWLAGTALLIKNQVFCDLSGFDENMFMYGEDVELCLRAKSEKLTRDYFHQPQIIHIGQASGSSASARLGEYQAIKYIFQKHKPSWQLPILRLWLKIGALLRILIFGIIGRDGETKRTYQKAYKLA